MRGLLVAAATVAMLHAVGAVMHYGIPRPAQTLPLAALFIVMVSLVLVAARRGDRHYRRP